MKLQLEYITAKYGAQMGRMNRLPANTNANIKLHLERMSMVDGDYDSFGVYWGKVEGKDMYVAWRDLNHTVNQAVRVYVKTATRQEAKEEILAILPNAKFYR
jgi:hypothetical protein